MDRELLQQKCSIRDRWEGICMSGLKQGFNLCAPAASSFFFRVRRRAVSSGKIKPVEQAMQLMESSPDFIYG
jgi:hypothetical protein